jgi:hypothetical protein
MGSECIQKLKAYPETISPDRTLESTPVEEAVSESAKGIGYRKRGSVRKAR